MSDDGEDWLDIGTDDGDDADGAPEVAAGPSRQAAEAAANAAAVAQTALATLHAFLQRLRVE